MKWPFDERPLLLFASEGLRWPELFRAWRKKTLILLALPSEQSRTTLLTHDGKSAGNATFFRNLAINRSATRAPGLKCGPLRGEIVEIFYNLA